MKKKSKHTTETMFDVDSFYCPAVEVYYQYIKYVLNARRASETVIIVAC